MSSNISNQVAYLRTTREFPEDPKQLSVELNRSYVDIAQNVNSRTIGLFSVNKSSVNGENWFLSGNKKREGQRQVYQFTAAGNIAHGLNLSTITIVRIYGTFTDGSAFYPLPLVNVVSATNQVSVTVDGTNIVITAGAGSPPSISSGIVVLEWVTNV